MKLKQKSFKTVLKLFRFSFISLCGQFNIQTIAIAAVSYVERFADFADVLCCKAVVVPVQPSVPEILSSTTFMKTQNDPFKVVLFCAYCTNTSGRSSYNYGINGSN